MKVKVGDYVRFKDGRIDKIADIRTTYSDRELITFEQSNSCKSDIGLKAEITKCSRNIADLVEANDIVTVEQKNNSNLMWEETMKVTAYTDGRTGREILRVNKYDIHNVKIKSILTHEQYKKKCFRLEERE